MRILIVDDSRVMRQIVTRTLRQAGYSGHDLVEAGNGVEGLAAVAQHEPDLVLSDWNMPEMNGIDFVRNLRATPQGKSVPVLMVTTNAANADVAEALKAGVNNYVVKPFTADTLKEKINAVAAHP